MKEEVKKEENEMSDQPEEKTETELRSDMGQLLQEFEALELQMRKLKAGVSADSLDSTGNYSFARMVIEGEVETLSTAVSGVQQRLNNEVDMMLASLTKVRQLLFLVQDRQEKMYNEFTERLSFLSKADQEKQEDIMKLESIFNESMNKLRMMIDDSAKNSTMSLYDKTEVLKDKMSQQDQENKMRMDGFKNELHVYSREQRNNTEQSFKILSQYLLRLSETTGQDNTLSKYGLDNAMRKLEVSGSSM